MPSVVQAAFGRRLADLRRQRGLTQAALAERAGIATNTVGSYERGAKTPRPVTLERLATALDVAPDRLAFGPSLADAAEEGSPLADLLMLLREEEDHVVRVVADLASVIVPALRDAAGGGATVSGAVRDA